MLCERCDEHQATQVVEYKDSFFFEEICEFCLDKDQENIELIVDDTSVKDG